MALDDEPLPSPPNGGAETANRYRGAMARSYLMRAAVVGFPVVGFFGAFLGGLFMIHVLGELTLWPIALGAILPTLGLALWFRMDRLRDEQNTKIDAADWERERNAERKAAIARARAEGAFDRFEK